MSTNTNYFKINKSTWNEKVKIHAKSEMYNMDAFKAGPKNKFDSFDLLPEWDYMALAKAYGANGHQVKCIRELNKVFKKLKKQTNKPTLVEIIIPEKDLPQQMCRLGVE